MPLHDVQGAIQRTIVDHPDLGHILRLAQAREQASMVLPLW
jgi:hypothetical protein